MTKSLGVKSSLTTKISVVFLAAIIIFAALAYIYFQNVGSPDDAQSLFVKAITLIVFVACIIKILIGLKKRERLERELQEKNNVLIATNQELERKNQLLEVANKTILSYTESTIKKQELLFETAVNNIPTPIIIFSLDAEVEFFNEASINLYKELGLDLYNLPPIEECRNKFSDFYACFDYVVEGQEFLEREISFPLPDGSYKTSIIRILAIRENDQISKVLVLSFDITDRKKYEDELLKLNKNLDQKVKERTTELEMLYSQVEKNVEEMQDLYENAPLGYYSLDAEARFIKINKTSLNLLGYTREELLGKNIKEQFLPEDVWQNFETSFQKMKGGGKIENIEAVFMKKDKTLLPVLLNVTPILDDKGNFIMSRSAFNDNTEVVKARTEIEKYVEALQIVNKDLEAFSYSISHDLRAPLRSVNGFGQILKNDYSDKLDQEGNRYLDIIILNSSQMGSMIDSLLEFSKLGRRGMNKSYFNLGELIQEVINQAVDFNKDLPEIVFSIERMPLIYADRNLFKQVWINLILNSIKFTSRRTDPKIWIKCKEDLNFYTFIIEDNGVGFDSRYASKLFGVFQRLHSNEEFEGTGAGLAIAKRIVTSHGGEIWAESDLGKGACFYFSLPKN